MKSYRGNIKGDRSRLIFLQILDICRSLNSNRHFLPYCEVEQISFFNVFRFPGLVVFEF